MASADPEWLGMLLETEVQLRHDPEFVRKLDEDARGSRPARQAWLARAPGPRRVPAGRRLRPPRPVRVDRPERPRAARRRRRRDRRRAADRSCCTTRSAPGSSIAAVRGKTVLFVGAGRNQRRAIGARQELGAARRRRRPERRRARASQAADVGEVVDFSDVDGVDRGRPAARRRRRADDRRRPLPCRSSPRSPRRSGCRESAPRRRT